jgi:DNA-binding CsgD family transcriptional regulator
MNDQHGGRGIRLACLVPVQNQFISTGLQFVIHLDIHGVLALIDHNVCAGNHRVGCFGVSGAALDIAYRAKISGIVRNRMVAANLTVREREVAKLSAFGFTVKEISARLYISESTVKQTMFNVIQKTGINDRSEFASIL